jgi:hypothetical protein
MQFLQWLPRVRLIFPRVSYHQFKFVSIADTLQYLRIVIDETQPLDIVGCNLLRKVAGTLLYCSELTEWCVVLCVAFADVRDKSKAFVRSISIVHVVLSPGLLICNVRGIVLRFAQICKIMFKVWRCHCARVHPLSRTGGTACKDLRLYRTLDGVLNCNNCFLVEYYITSFKLCTADTWCVVHTGGGVLSWPPHTKQCTWQIVFHGE